MIISIEAMHLLPHPFDIQAPHPPPRVVCGMTALLLPAVVRFFTKACRTSSRGRLFRFGHSTDGSRQERPLAIHCLDDASSSPEILLSIPRFSFVLLRALRLLKRAPTNLLTPNLSYNYVTGWIPPQRNTLDKTGSRNSDDPWRQ
ncbi:hypothetical protein E0H35_07550 [Rhizobium leguminosarum bv. viciae]|nr:hypothetical protein [Rhizobium leguminosarum bv. viciae]TBF89483.1 hypothetical protein ELG85_30570 [Rhizobium leguminosarum]TBZ02720.1 hypothetical protein E0H35_07550 [Rhizobium leguminosarum bv. viciae]